MALPSARYSALRTLPSMASRSGEGEEELVEAPHVFAGFDGTVLGHILRQGQYQRLALIQYVDLLPLGFREAVRCPHCRHRDQRAGSQKEHAEEPQVAKGRFYILQCFEFHILLRFIVSSKPLLYGLRHFRPPLRRLRQRPSPRHVLRLRLYRRNFRRLRPE